MSRPHIAMSVLETASWPVQDMLPTFMRVLDDAERSRAARFVRPRDAHDYMVAHGACRMLLGQVLSVPPALLRFTTAKAGGKPRLAWPAQAGVDFNISHTQGLVMCAVASQPDEAVALPDPAAQDTPEASRIPTLSVGVDCEDVRAEIDDASLDTYCCEAEIRTLHRRPPSWRHVLWTLKEALAKACGSGLSLDLRTLRIEMPQAGAPQVLAVAPDMGRADEWHLHHWQPTARHVATLAYRTPDGSPARIEHINVLEAVA